MGLVILVFSKTIEKRRKIIYHNELQTHCIMSENNLNPLKPNLTQRLLLTLIRSSMFSTQLHSPFSVEDTVYTGKCGTPITEH